MDISIVKVIQEAVKAKMKEGEIIAEYLSECCDAPVRFSENSGVYVCPGIYCDKCHKLL